MNIRCPFNQMNYMKLEHMHKRAVKNSLFRVVNELDVKMYPLGLKEEVKYVEDIHEALNCKFSKVDIANMLRRIMSYVIMSNSSVLTKELLAKKVAKNITEEDLSIVIAYILSNNQYIAKLCHSPTQNDNKDFADCSALDKFLTI